MNESTDQRYLDLDDDGVIDAVETVTVAVEEGADATTVEVVDEIDAEIDDEGVAHRVTVVDAQARLER